MEFWSKWASVFEIVLQMYLWWKYLYQYYSNEFPIIYLKAPQVPPEEIHKFLLSQIERNNKRESYLHFVVSVNMNFSPPVLFVMIVPQIGQNIIWTLL